MSRPLKPSVDRRGKTYWIFFTHKGKRVRESCKTTNKHEARKILKEIELLLIDDSTQVSEIANKIFFGERKLQLNDEIGKQLKKYPLDTGDDFIMASLAQKVADLEKELAIARIECDEAIENFNNLKGTIEAHRAIQAIDCPKCEDVIDSYSSYVSHLHRKGTNHINLIKDLFDHSDSWDRKIIEIAPFDIYNFLSIKSKISKDPGEYWNRKRRTFYKFWKWLNFNYGCDNIITKVETMTEQPKEVLNWHSLEELEEEISRQNDYWAAIISTMGYAGLSAHELRGLKRNDFDGEFITVQHYKEARIKTSKRIRKVRVHKKLLLPRLNQYLKSAKASEWLFPSFVAGSERWKQKTFYSNITNAIKTPGMNCLSLRRTFGSLLLRSGKNEVEVSAAMGNSPEMVRRHYAILLGCEVDIDF